VAPGIVEIVEQRLGAGFAMPAEHLDADDLAEQAGGDVVRGAAEKAA